MGKYGAGGIITDFPRAAGHLTLVTIPGTNDIYGGPTADDLRPATVLIDARTTNGRKIHEVVTRLKEQVSIMGEKKKLLKK